MLRSAYVLLSFGSDSDSSLLFKFRAMGTSVDLLRKLHQVSEKGNQMVESAIEDEHGGVIVDMTEPMDPEAFTILLRDSLALWRRLGKKGVWIKLPKELVNLVQSTVEEGFIYHHAEPHYLMLVYWIPDTTSTIPANASHQVRIGAIVLKDKREMLVVQEKSGPFQGMGVWKIPTGVVEEGEDIFKAAVREVKEETGIETEFLEILAFRQSHNSFFSKSDLCFLCVLRPISFDIQKQEQEIEAAQWMPVEEFASQPFSQKNEFSKYITHVCLEEVKRDIPGFSPIPIKSISDQLSHLYLNKQDLNLSLNS